MKKVEERTKGEGAKRCIGRTVISKQANGLHVKLDMLLGRGVGVDSKHVTVQLFPLTLFRVAVQTRVDTMSGLHWLGNSLWSIAGIYFQLAMFGKTLPPVTLLCKCKKALKPPFFFFFFLKCAH